MNTTTSDNLRGVERWFFNRAKFLGAFALGSRMVAFLVGVVGFLYQPFAPVAPYLAGLAVLLATAFDFFADGNMSGAEAILRKLEFEDALGWKISSSERADLLMRIPQAAHRQMMKQNQNLGGFFDSKEPIGAKRAAQNIEESAWWTKHLCQTMSRFYGWLGGLLLVSVIIGMIYLIGFASSATQLPMSEVARVVTGVVSFIATTGLLRFAVVYYRLHLRATSIEAQAKKLREGNPSEAEAVKLYAEYHIARVSAPAIPSWVWSYRQKRLNEIWKLELSNR
jgi:hypothetical protein